MSSGAPPSRPWRVWPVLALLLAAGGWVFATAVPLLRAEFPTLAERHLATQWSSGVGVPTSREQWTDVRRELLDAAAIQSKDPGLYEMLGNLHRVGADQSWATEAERTEWLRQAQAHYRRSLQLRPGDALTWALLAHVLADSGELGGPMASAAQRALELGPNETHVRQAVLTLTLRYWAGVPDALKDWAGALFEQGTQGQRDAINAMAREFGLEFSSDQPPRQPPPRR